MISLSWTKTSSKQILCESIPLQPTTLRVLLRQRVANKSCPAVWRIRAMGLGHGVAESCFWFEVVSIGSPTASEPAVPPLGLHSESCLLEIQPGMIEVIKKKLKKKTVNVYVSWGKHSAALLSLAARLGDSYPGFKYTAVTSLFLHLTTSRLCVCRLTDCVCLLVLSRVKFSIYYIVHIYLCVFVCFHLLFLCLYVTVPPT